MRVRDRGGLATAALVAGLAGALALCPSAGAQLYWANEGTNTISRASLDGLTVDASYVTGATAPTGVAIDGLHVYWSHAGGVSGSIGRADLDGTTNKTQTLISTSSAPQGVALDSARVYWTHVVSSAGEVGRATLAGFGVNPSFVATANTSPCGVASDADDEYWANGGSPGSIGSAHGNTLTSQNLIPGTFTSDPCGVARAGPYLYWANQGGESIGRADLDGSNPIPSFVDTDPAGDIASVPCGLAIDGSHIYWADQGTDKIGRADIDGSDPDPDFISAGIGSDPCGMAVSPTQEPSPSSYAFSDTAAGSHSAIQAFAVANTASSVLDVTGVSLVGPNPAEFEKAGDGCTPNSTAAGNACFINVRFAPTAEAASSAILRITSNASNSPTDVVLSGTGIAPASSSQPAPSAETEAPDTTISTGPPAKTRKKTADFEFSSSEPGSSFECRLDAAAFEPCSSPKHYRVGKGKHSFEVRATDAAGNTDPTPATRSWKVKKKKRRK